MVKRCQICGTPVDNVTVCNYCETVREERRFFNMIKREELDEARIINQMNRTDLIKPAANK